MVSKLRSLSYATTNDLKFQVADRVLAGSGITLEQLRLDVPEIQSLEVEEVAKASAVWASLHHAGPVAVTDAGFYIKALNGFPGPFVKFVNHWLSAADVLRLMRGRADRSVFIRECLAFCPRHQQPAVFSTTYDGTLALKAGRPAGTTMDQLFIPAGRSVPICEIPEDEMLAYWGHGSVWQQLRQYLLAGIGPLGKPTQRDRTGRLD